MISAGDFDPEISDYIEFKQGLAENARQVRSTIITAPVKVITEFRVIAAE
jgi:hypothetical protein